MIIKSNAEKPRKKPQRGTHHLETQCQRGVVRDCGEGLAKQLYGLALIESANETIDNIGLRTSGDLETTAAEVQMQRSNTHVDAVRGAERKLERREIDEIRKA